MARDVEEIGAVIYQLDTISTKCTFNTNLLRSGSSYTIKRLSRYHANVYHAQETDLLHEFLVQLSHDSDKDYTAATVNPAQVVTLWHLPGGTAYKTSILLGNAFKRLKYLGAKVIFFDLER